MQISIPKERLMNEARVAITPKTVTELIKLGFDVVVERGAGELASFSDIAYETAGAILVDRTVVFQADIIIMIHAPELAEVAQIKQGGYVISLVSPALHPELLEQLAARQITTLAMDCVPRISRAQSMDVLSSMANIAGYRAVIEAAHEFGRFFTGQITAAGKIPPAKVLVIGAGVAGLAALGTAGSLGAIVRAFDTRPEVKEQVQSMGAQFLELAMLEQAGSGDGYAKEMSEAYIDAEKALFMAQAKEVDIIITTAMIPGKEAPKLLSAELVESMKPGSVIVDLAAQTGGNCELTIPGRLITAPNGVKIIGYTDFPSRLPTQSSQLYANNILNLLKLLSKPVAKTITIDFNDDITRGVTVTRAGEVTWPAPAIQVSSSAQTQAQTTTPVSPSQQRSSRKGSIIAYIFSLLLIAMLIGVAHALPTNFLSLLGTFVLACVVGYYVIWNVRHALHTPLMAVTNAISGIIIVGALQQIGHQGFWIPLLSFLGVLIASINIFGGFYVTQRMLNMFRKR